MIASEGIKARKTIVAEIEKRNLKGLLRTPSQKLSFTLSFAIEIFLPLNFF